MMVFNCLKQLTKIFRTSKIWSSYQLPLWCCVHQAIEEKRYKDLYRKYLTVLHKATCKM